MKQQILKVMVFGLLVFGMPLGVFAQESVSESEVARMCSSLEDMRGNFDEQIDTTRMALADRFSDRTERFESNWAERDSQRAERRRDQDARRVDLYADLIEKTGNEEAVGDFEEAVEAAMSAHRISADSAISASRSNVLSALATLEESLGLTLDTFESVGNGYFDEAQEACESGMPPQQVHEAFQAGMDDAHTAFTADKEENRGRMHEEAGAVKERFREELQESRSAFEGSMQAARDALKDALGE